MRTTQSRKDVIYPVEEFRLMREVLSSFLFTLGLFSALSLVFFSTRVDMSVKGTMGSAGVFIAHVMGTAFGVSAFVFPIVLFYTAFIIFRNRFSMGVYTKLAASFILLTGTTALFGLVYGSGDVLGYGPGGGWLGSALSTLLRDELAGTVGSYFVATLFILFGLMIMTNLTISAVLGWAGSALRLLGMKTTDSVKLTSTLAAKGAGTLGGVGRVVTSPLANALDGVRLRVVEGITRGMGGADEREGLNVISSTLSPTPSPRVHAPSLSIVHDADEQDDLIGMGSSDAWEGSMGGIGHSYPGDSAIETVSPKTIERESGTEDEPRIVVRSSTGSTSAMAGGTVPNDVPRRRHHRYALPKLDLLDPRVAYDFKVDKQAVIEQARLIEQKLLDFGVKGRVTEIRPGPVITMFEYKPAAGIKINKIAALDNDLAMALSALSVRIVAPIPGRDVVGIEVPNERREPVVLRELLENKAFVQSESMLTLAIGKDISGNPYYADLRKAPHLMIAGTTGSGKSVLLHSLITSMLYKSTPSELKYIMIDPKMLELSVYEDIPHLLHPIVTDPKEASAALRWAVREMESRYRLLSTEGVRDIEGYNRRLQRLDGAEREERWMPYIVIVIDELADLMMISPREVGESITRLAQKARAAGIHLVVATQRPSADVVAGLIKANFPARISFLVSSKIDSRIIMDVGGAEQLLGKGDMLFLQPGTFNLIRLQGALISDEERDKIADYLRTQAPAEFNQDITVARDSEVTLERDDERDEMFFDALRIVAESKQASISMLQRKLKIGYNRAARIVEVMEQEGIVGTQTVAGKPREVNIDVIEVIQRGMQ